MQSLFLYLVYWDSSESSSKQVTYTFTVILIQVNVDDWEFSQNPTYLALFMHKYTIHVEPENQNSLMCFSIASQVFMLQTLFDSEGSTPPGKC